MVRVVVVLAVLLAVLSDCDRANSPVEKQEKRGGVEKTQKQLQDADLPAYGVTQEENCTAARGYPTKCYVVSTDATSK